MTLRVLIAVLAVLCALCPAVPTEGVADSYQKVLRVQDGAVIGFDQMLREIRGVNPIFVGELHGYERGIPEQVRRRSSLTYRGILPETSGIIDRRVVTVQDADYLLIE